MGIAICGSTTHGKKKSVNQDNYGFRCVKKEQDWIAFSVVCDGVGGLSQGEKASAIVTARFLDWFDREFICLYDQGFQEEQLRSRWTDVLLDVHRQLLQRGRSSGEHLGTTIAVLLICRDNYYCMNIGDTRVYCIHEQIRQISVDHSLMQMKLDDGTLSVEDIDGFSKKNVLFQCIGFNETLKITFRSGKSCQGSVWLLCSDGFRNKISEREIFDFFNPIYICDHEQLKQIIKDAVELNLSREERDDITLVVIWIGKLAVAVEDILSEDSLKNPRKGKEKMFCSKCGCKCDEDASFCFRCGAPLVQNREMRDRIRKKTFVPLEDDDVTQNNGHPGYGSYCEEDDDVTQISGNGGYPNYDDDPTVILDGRDDIPEKGRSAGHGVYDEGVSKQQGRGLATKKDKKQNRKRKEKRKTSEKEQGSRVTRIILIVLCVLLAIMLLLVAVSTFL